MDRILKSKGFQSEVPYDFVTAEMQFRDIFDDDLEDPGGFYAQPYSSYADSQDQVVPGFGGRIPSAADSPEAKRRPLPVGRIHGGPQASDWCFTAHVKPGLCGDSRPAEVTYFIYQEEVSENGIHHWQGFLQLDKRMRLHQVQNIIGDLTAHCELRKGTAQQAADYCRKLDSAVPGTIVEDGIMRNPKVNHLDDLKNAMDRGASEADLMENHFAAWTRAERACAKYIQARDAKIRREWCQPRVELHWGASRTGKTRYVRDWIDKHNDGQAFDKPSGPWWNGYTNQRVVLFDDFDGTLPLDTLLQLLDGYGFGMNLPTKGSVVTNQARIFFFTSNKEISEWYPHATSEQQNALQRRFTLIKEYRHGDVFVKAEPADVIVLE